jgi:hypothetical protein
MAAVSAGDAEVAAEDLREDGFTVMKITGEPAKGGHRGAARNRVGICARATTAIAFRRCGHCRVPLLPCFECRCGGELRIFFSLAGKTLSCAKPCSNFAKISEFCIACQAKRACWRGSTGQASPAKQWRLIAAVIS